MGSITTKIRDMEREDEPASYTTITTRSQSYGAILERIRLGMADTYDAGRVDALIRAAHSWGAEGQSLGDFLDWANQEG